MVLKDELICLFLRKAEGWPTISSKFSTPSSLPAVRLIKAHTAHCTRWNSVYFSMFPWKTKFPLDFYGNNVKEFASYLFGGIYPFDLLLFYLIILFFWSIPTPKCNWLLKQPLRVIFLSGHWSLTYNTRSSWWLKLQIIWL